MAAPLVDLYKYLTRERRFRDVVHIIAISVCLLFAGNAFAAWTDEGVGALSDALGANPITPAWPTHTTGDVGILPVCVGSIDATYTVATPSGWTLLHAQGVGAFQSLYVFGRVATSATESAPSIAITAGDVSDNIIGRITVFRGGVLTEAPESAGAETATGLTWTYSAITPSADNELVLIAGCGSEAPGTTGITAESGFTTDYFNADTSGSDAVLTLIYQIQTTATAISAGALDMTGANGQQAETATIALALTNPAPDFDSISYDSLDFDTVRVTVDANADADNIHVACWAVDTSAPADGAAVEAASGAIGSASAAATGASQTIDIDLSPDPAHPIVDCYAVAEAGTSNYSAVDTEVDIAMDPASDCGAGADELCAHTTLTSIGLASLVSIFDLGYDAQTANFLTDACPGVVSGGELVTGGNSSATGRIMADTDGGTTGTLKISVLSGTFENDETLTGDGCDGVWTGGAAVVNGTATAYFAATDIVVYPSTVMPLDVPLTISASGYGSYPDSTESRQSALSIRVFDRSAQDFHSEEVDWWNLDPVIVCQADINPFVMLVGTALGVAPNPAEIVFYSGDPETDRCNHPLSDALSASVYAAQSDALLTGLSIASDTLVGTVASEVSETSSTWYFKVESDTTGGFSFFTIVGYGIESWTLGDYTGQTASEFMASIDALTLNTATSTFNNTCGGTVDSYNPGEGDEIAPGDTIAAILSRGFCTKSQGTSIGIGIRL